MKFLSFIFLIAPSLVWATCDSGYSGSLSGTITEAYVSLVSSMAPVYTAGSCNPSMLVSFSSFKENGVAGTCKTVTISGFAASSSADCISMQQTLLKTFTTAFALQKKVQFTTAGAGSYVHTSHYLSIMD